MLWYFLNADQLIEAWPTSSQSKTASRIWCLTISSIRSIRTLSQSGRSWEAALGNPSQAQRLTHAEEEEGVWSESLYDGTVAASYHQSSGPNCSYRDYIQRPLPYKNALKHTTCYISLWQHGGKQRYQLINWRKLRFPLILTSSYLNH